jgi:hypothetical protein
MRIRCLLCIRADCVSPPQRKLRKKRTRMNDKCPICKKPIFDAEKRMVAIDQPLRVNFMVHRACLGGVATFLQTVSQILEKMLTQGLPENAEKWYNVGVDNEQIPRNARKTIQNKPTKRPRGRPRKQG